MMKNKNELKGKRVIPEKFFAMVAAGAKGTDLCKEFGVSIPTIQNWKKKAGLVRK